MLTFNIYIYVYVNIKRRRFKQYLYAKARSKSHTQHSIPYNPHSLSLCFHRNVAQSQRRPSKRVNPTALQIPTVCPITGGCS